MAKKPITNHEHGHETRKVSGMALGQQSVKRRRASFFETASERLEARGRRRRVLWIFI
jgi:hypothetical protein